MLTSLIRDNANERFISPSLHPRTHSFETPFFSIVFTVPYCQCCTRNIFKRNHTPINCSSNVPTFRNICIFALFSQQSLILMCFLCKNACEFFAVFILMTDNLQTKTHKIKPQTYAFRTCYRLTNSYFVGIQFARSVI